jgi:2-polyprenyl-3-methyl-5-hydroxy-6-metoxy-1,4-benzoquinol methylase
VIADQQRPSLPTHPGVTTDTNQQRWEAEAAFFDRVAAETARSLKPTDPRIVARYANNRRRRFPAEYRFHLAGDLRGRSVLDVGCGEGRSSALLAKLGATVMGIDISPGSIEVARRRAELDGVADRTSFVCAPLETAELPESHFDVIWCDAILHHLLNDLDVILPRFRQWVKPGGIVILSEPANLSQSLRKLRFTVAAPSDHTPDERPLEQQEFDLVRRVFPEAEFRFFRAFTRFDRYLLPDHQYETAAPWRRAVYDAASALDWALLSVPPLHPLAGFVVIGARVQK